MLVTGAAGFIGCNFVRHILQNNTDIEVVSYDKLTYAGREENLQDLPNAEQHNFVRGDICDEELVAKTLGDYNIDTIVHFAAESHVDRSIANPAEFVYTNVLGTFNLLDSARKFWFGKLQLTSDNCRFHHVSTDEVYGQLAMTDSAFSETTPYDPSSPYSASKAASDHFVRAYGRTYGLPVTLSNCSNNYGPYQHEEKLIPVVVKSCLDRHAIPVYGNGSNIRDWLYVEDHCRAIYVIVRRGNVGDTYNVGGKCEMDNLTLVKMICDIMDKKRPIDIPHSDLINFVKDRPGHDWRYAIDNSKIQTQLNWRPQHDLRSGLEKTVNYYLDLYSC
ncbi:MAG: dTDP-glucose 4,6-dehydratase [Gammaproteobacteria bacterium]|nr:dTDP-glucose 4,6-dehydratase [Gammaproteobacteria bacterium]